MARKGSTGVPKCKACGYPMIMDETIVEGRGGLKIRRTFLHCVNGQCGHIERTGEYPIDTASGDTGLRTR